MKEELYTFFVQESIDCQLKIEQCYRYRQEDFVVAQLSLEEGDHLMAICTDEDEGDSFDETKEMLLEAMGCRYLLLVWESRDENRLLFFSESRKIRALEFLDYLIAQFGLVRGCAQCATGQISTAILSVQISDMDLDDALEYYLQMSKAYFTECDWIVAREYANNMQGTILDMSKYQKKMITWAYVKSTDVVPAGEIIKIKSLENESGMLLTADENRYIMIGCRGEVYDMDVEKFQNTYEESDEQLDIFEQMLDFLPAIEVLSTGEYISLDEAAHICYPRRGIGIYACELERRTKIFPVDNEEDYYLGRPGDYMAIRMDDFTDVYIIQREIFLQTYEADN
ncbi:MAG: hypothetical protein E7264_09975 [Lachnospiraceae bacterium]|nr:hypothetical protein [Lachnospiraceae bacterium]